MNELFDERTLASLEASVAEDDKGVAGGLAAALPEGIEEQLGIGGENDVDVPRLSELQPKPQKRFPSLQSSPRLPQQAKTGAVDYTIKREIPKDFETRFLNTIGGAEAPHGYDQAFGESAPKVKLTSLTLGEVMKLQQDRVKANPKVKSVAMGRYQFISSTLAEEIEKSGIPLTAKFDKAAQDKLALQLIAPAIERLRETGDVAEFQDSVALKWAGVPRATSISGHPAGKSHYWKDGVNGATITGGQFVRGSFGK